MFRTHTRFSGKKSVILVKSAVLRLTRAGQSTPPLPGEGPSACGLPGRFVCEHIAVLCLSVLFLGTVGCTSGSGSNSGGKAGPISITNPNSGNGGQLTSLAVNTTVQLSMTPTGSGANAGVDWGVLCGGSPLTGSMAGGACGTFVPTHTPSGVATMYTVPALVPLGTMVTITASLTSNPSANSSITLPVTGPPISIGFSSPPASVGEGGTVSLTVKLQNDTTSAGVKWSAACSISPCGSFNPASGTQANISYIAPAVVPQGTITITATSIADSTKSTVTSLTVLPIAVSVTPLVAYAQAGSTTQFKAALTNDGANSGVNWSVNCPTSSGCSITGHTTNGATATLTAPSAASGITNVTITATSATDSSHIGTAAANITNTAPINVVLSPPPPATLAINGQTNLTATVTSDPTNAGVSWVATCQNTQPGACGIVTPTGGSGTTYTATYVAPSAVPTGSVVTITAAPLATGAANPGTASVTITGPPSITFTQEPPTTMTVNTGAPVSATVANDTTPGGVNWSVMCGDTTPGACGYVSPYHTDGTAAATYHAPPFVPNGNVSVMVIATSASTVFTKITKMSTPIQIVATTALSIRFASPVPSQMQVSSTISVNAAVGNDPSNAGVDYSVCGACGYFTIKPDIPAVPATETTPYIPEVLPVTATSVQGWPNGLPIPYTAPTNPSSVTIMATAHANGGPNISAPIAINPNNIGPALNGSVLAGTTPVVGASVSLYAASTSGYGSQSTLVYAPKSGPYVVTDNKGNFTIAGGYSCPQPNTEVYLVAQGGNAGTAAANPNLTLMSALGPCSNLNSAPLVVNEVTTVASSWALAPFAASDLLTGNKSYLNIGTSSGNIVGLANAFASVTNLVNLSTGEPLFVVPAGNATVPYAEINTLADILNACTSTSGGSEGDGSPCGTLFTNTDGVPPTSPLYVAPVTDTLQAAFNIAQHPDGGFGYIIFPSNIGAQAAPSQPFQPMLSKAPHDWSLALNYTGGGGLSASSSVKYLVADVSGNLWMTDSNNNSVIEWNSLGAALSPATGYSAGGLNAPGPLAIDATGDVWVVSKNGLTELNFVGTPFPGSPYTGVTGGSDLSIDGSGNIWVSNSNSVYKFNSVGLELSPASGYTNSGVMKLGALAIDSSNNVWVSNVVSGGYRARPRRVEQCRWPAHRRCSPRQRHELSPDGCGRLRQYLGRRGDTEQ